MLDDDKCYHACHSKVIANTTIKVDLDETFQNEIKSLQETTDESFSLSLFSSETTKFSLTDAWLSLKTLESTSTLFATFVEKNENRTFNSNARFGQNFKCIFNLPSSSASSPCSRCYYSKLNRLSCIIIFFVFFNVCVQRIFN